MVSIVYEVVHEVFKEPIIKPLKSKMAEIRHLENRHDVIYFCNAATLAPPQTEVAHI